jgi:anti-sigma regulatory factor (Ser/Thr protein kinase)
VTSAQTWDLSYQPTGLLSTGTCTAGSNGRQSDTAHEAAGGQDVARPPDLVKQDAVSPDAALPESAPPGPGQADDRHCQVTLCSALESAKLARDFTRDTLRGWQLDSVVHEAVIIASELVTNAIRHGVSMAAGNVGQSGVGLSWQRHASRLICVVTDQSTKPPVLGSAGPDAESGRGLQVVQALAVGWGWMMLGAQEKAVWAALLLPAGS